MINNYSNLSIRDYLKIIDICKRKDLEDIDLQVQILSVLTGKTTDELITLPITEYKSLVAQMEFLESKPSEDKHILNAYKIKDWTLIPFKEVHKFSVAQYIDFQEFIKGGEKNASKILSIFLIPKGKEYNKGYDIEKLQEDLDENMSITIYNTICAFFFRSWHYLIKALGVYLKIMMWMKKNKDMGQISQILKDLDDVGVGLQTWMQCLKPAVPLGKWFGI